MKTATLWSYKHYLPLHLKERKNAPYICRIAPFADGFEFDIYDDCENSSYILKWKIRGEDTENVQELDGKHGKVDGLASDTDYALSAKTVPPPPNGLSERETCRAVLSIIFIPMTKNMIFREDTFALLRS